MRTLGFRILFFRIHVSLRKQNRMHKGDAELKMDRTWCTFVINLLSIGNLKELGTNSECKDEKSDPRNKSKVDDL